MKRSLIALAAAALIAGPAAAEDPFKACFVYVGPVGDFGWSYQHDQGRQAVEAAYGDAVQTSFVESVSEGADAERVLRQLASSGCGIIFTTSFGYMDATLKVAKEFPDVAFEHATGFKRADNVATYNARFYEGRTVLGTIAARMTKSKKIGYVGAYPIPEVYQGINAATLAARRIDPEIEMHVVWVNAWYDHGREADAAKALLAKGVDVIMQHTDSPGPLQAAANAGALAFGQATDMHRFGPNAQLTAIIDDWGPYYIDRVGAAMHGDWSSTDVWDGIAEGGVLMAPYWNMPYAVALEAKGVEDAIRLHKRHPFMGPIVSREGETMVPEGEALSDEEMLGMTWFVEGVIGDDPN